MKIAILFLFAFVAVSQAAFTANLVQRAQPVLAKTFAQARSQLRTRSDNGLETTLFQGLSEYMQEMIQSLSDAIDAGTATFASVMATVNELQDLGGSAVDAATAILSNFWNSMFGGSKRALDLNAVIAALSSLDLDSILGFAFQYVANLISQLEIPSVIEGFLSTILNHEIVQAVMGQLFGRQKGLFGDLIGTLTGAAQNLATQVAEFVAQIQKPLEAGLAQVAVIAQQMLAEAQAQAVEMTQHAANVLIAQLAPLAQQLGAQYQQIVAMIQSLVGRN